MVQKVVAGALVMVIVVVAFAFAQNQADLNQEAKTAYDKADAELN